MDFHDMVVVATYTDHPSAEAALSLLRSEGLEAEMSADDAGGELPNLDIGRSIRVYVEPKDAEFARGLLEGG